MIIISKATRQLVVPSTIAAPLFPQAPTLMHRGLQHIVIPHGPRESLLLTRLGHKVPAPILSDYDWSGGKPFKVQLQTCSMLTSSPRAYVLNDMGTGKTKAALWAWDYLNKVGCANKLLVVAPLSTLHFVWAREVFATIPHRRTVVLHGTRDKRLQLLASDADIYVINHDGLKVIAKEIAARADIDTLVLDELAVYRNNSERSKHMREFAKPFAWVWGMTGSPMPNTPVDVWAQCKIITPDSVPKFKRNAEQQLMHYIQTVPFPVMKPKPDAVDTAFKWMQPAVRFKLDDVVELPPAITRSIEVALSPEQKSVYTRMLHEMIAMVREKKITAANAGVAMGKLLQVAGGYVYTTNPEFVELDSDNRKRALVELLEAAEHKVIIFAPYKHLISGLSSHLTHHNLEHAVVHGDTKNRENIFAAFQQTEKYPRLLAHPQCVHHGLTLTAADTTVWYLPVTSLEIYEQANARIRRIGQKHKQQFLQMRATPVEQKIYAMLDRKDKDQAKLLTLFEEATEGQAQ